MGRNLGGHSGRLAVGRDLGHRWFVAEVNYQSTSHRKATSEFITETYGKEVERIDRARLTSHSSGWLAACADFNRYGRGKGYQS